MSEVLGVLEYQTQGVATVKFQRLMKGIKQRDVARQLGISQASYSRIESGIARPTLSQFLAMLNAVGLVCVIVTQEE